ncbi:Methyltransferase type 11 [Moorella glycerini]|uniref:Methyltransferase n=1 Tax=Neomoorella stamsii TaxID=1266720 RepID=A0A9X7J5R8_9FIRM|nr:MULTISPECIES: class I SAM-dependent methyltransferase [Moorella]PRR77052.1 putative methyltransferase [Moorella stamsii]CEP68827.1 Methyltransferase type 11 [Moorella glycerini]
MSAEANLVLELVSPGGGLVLDLGGGSGILRDSLEKMGYYYVNVDIQRFDNGEPTVIADAQELPFKNNSFDVIISKDSLEHFAQPCEVIKEIYRVLKPGGRFIVWVPFMHPFHGDDFYRYTPLGLRHLLRGFEITLLDSPFGVFSLLGSLISEVLRRLGFSFAIPFLRRISYWFDTCFSRQQGNIRSFAAGYRIVAFKGEVTR